MNNSVKYKNFNKLYIFTWILYSVAYVVNGITLLPGKYPFIGTVYEVAANGTIIILLFLFLLGRRYSLAKLLLYISFIFLVFLIEISDIDRTFLISIMFMINANRVDIRKLMVVDIKLKTFLLIIVLLFCACGIIENRIWIVGGVYKQGLGFTNPNTTAAFILTILIEWMCSHYGSIKKYQYLVIFILWYIVDYMCGARTSGYTFLVIFILYILSAIVPQIFYTNVSKIAFVLLMPMMAGLSFLFSYLYMNGNAFVIMLDKIMTGRIRYSAYALARYEVNFFGQPVDTIFNSTSSLILDNAYVQGVLRYGFLYMIFLCVVYAILFIKLIRYRQINMVLLGMFYVVTGLGESYLFLVIYNISLLYLLCADEQNMDIENDSAHMLSRFRIRFEK